MLYTAKLGESICARLADGEKLVDICREEGMPSLQSVCRWRAAIPSFALMYDAARQDRAERYVEEIINIADDDTRDRKQDVNGGIIVDHENINRARLRVDTRKWVAAKVLPKIYGDKVLHTGGDGEGPVEHRLAHDYSLLEPEELVLLRRLLEKMTPAPQPDDSEVDDSAG